MQNKCFVFHLGSACCRHSPLQQLQKKETNKQTIPNPFSSPHQENFQRNHSIDQWGKAEAASRARSGSPSPLPPSSKPAGTTPPSPSPRTTRTRTRRPPPIPSPNPSAPLRVLLQDLRRLLLHVRPRGAPRPADEGGHRRGRRRRGGSLPGPRDTVAGGPGEDEGAVEGRGDPGDRIAGAAGGGGRDTVRVPDEVRGDGGADEGLLRLHGAALEGAEPGRETRRVLC
ncbi:putative NAD(P)H dehydrogenase (quinone) FQR1-like 2 [Iris pallida]|uniref:NAD(P)H dehydrogenase (Quinone) FQR1-like 2 n=1 Tax=Iris pallida TaxID=29817 RepID=A0AAX6ECK5_IRIPA|nr:putative NAD(P)H dehydrogenase (quinone) FQR1-like 2 [Iris pallida]